MENSLVSYEKIDWNVKTKEKLKLKTKIKWDFELSQQKATICFILRPLKITDCETP